MTVRKLTSDALIKHFSVSALPYRRLSPAMFVFVALGFLGCVSEQQKRHANGVFDRDSTCSRVLGQER
jgi:hypothetical protein